MRAVWGSISLTPPYSLLITDAHNSLYSHPPRKDRDKQLIETIVNTLRNEGNVLLPCDTAGRVLELALLLEDYWQLSVHPLSHSTNHSSTHMCPRCYERPICAQSARLTPLQRLPYPLVLFNYTATSTVDAAKRQLEWMSDSVVQKFENSRTNPFDFSCVISLVTCPFVSLLRIARLPRRLGSPSR